MYSRLGSTDSNEGHIYFNNNALSESKHYTSYGGSGTARYIGGREVTLEARAGDTIYFKTSAMQDHYYYIYFCVAFEHGSDHQSRFSADEEGVPGPEYLNSFPAGDVGIPGLEYQDSFPDDEEYFSADLEKSTCSSNADCPPYLACIRLSVVY